MRAFHTWSSGPVPIRAASLPRRHQMSVQTVCLGWHWQPYKYTRTAGDVNGQPVLPLPRWLVDLGRAVLTEAYDPSAADDWHPDTALVNFYDDTARLGMHQDKDEAVNEPVVSLSVGDTCQFRFGNTDNCAKPYTDLDLVSGDAFVFGRDSRFAYHGVPKTFPTREGTTTHRNRQAIRGSIWWSESGVFRPSRRWSPGVAPSSDLRHLGR